MPALDLRATAKLLDAIRRLICALIGLTGTAARYSLTRYRPAQALAAENLFLRKQLALFQEREIRPRRADDATRAAMVWLSKAFEWREALVIVKPGTLIRWHREGFRLFWKLKSRPGLPDPPSRLPVQLQEHRHRLPPVAGVTSRPILGGLHHDYALQLAA